MGKFTTKMAEEQEKQVLMDALCDGSLELNDEFLDKYFGETIRDILKRIPEKDRAYALGYGILDDNAFFNGGIPSLGNEDILIPCEEIEIQFVGKPEEYFEDVSAWYINGNFAYHYVGYGLTIPVDVEKLKFQVEGILEGYRNEK